MARAPTASTIKRAVRQAELRSGTGGTGYTILKLTAKPIARLIEKRQIGPEELQAAQDISTAFHSLTGVLWLRPLLMERLDKGHGGNEPAAIVDAQRRYRNWADHWSMLRKRGDRTMEIVIGAVIDERAFSTIENDIGLRHGIAKRATIRGLRDYAVRADWVKGQLAARWRAEAGCTFRTWHPDLVTAVARAKTSV
jgi:hypothetical protein